MTDGKQSQEPAEADKTDPMTGSGRGWDWMRSDEARSAAWSAGAAFLFAGSLFLLSPNGLSAAFGSIPAYLAGWWTPSDVTLGRLLLALVVYAWPALVLVVMTLVRRVRAGLAPMTRMTWWLVAALLLALVYPGRQVTDLAWALLPLYMLAARELARLLEIPRKRILELGATYGLMLIFGGYAWLNLMSMSQQDPNPATNPAWRNHLLIAAVALVVTALVPVMIGASWSKRVGRQAALGGFLTFAVVWLLAASVGTSGLREDKAAELWQPNPRIAHAGLLAATVDGLSERNTGDSHDLPVALAGTDWPSLRWALRSHPITITPGLDTDAHPALIVSTGDQDFSAGGNYAGQDFTWRQWTAWDAMTPLAWVNWVFHRSVPQTGEIIVLWVNTAQFPFETGQP